MPKHRITDASSPQTPGPEAVWVDSYAGPNDGVDHEFQLFPPYTTEDGTEHRTAIVRFYPMPGGYLPYILSGERSQEEVVLRGPFETTRIANDIAGYVSVLGYKVVYERTRVEEPLPTSPVVPEPIVGTPQPRAGKTLLFGLTGADGADFVLYDREDAERINAAENILGVPLSEIEEAPESQLDRLEHVLQELGLDQDGLPVADQAIAALTELLFAERKSDPRSPRGPVLTIEPTFPGACVQDFYGTCWESYGVDHWVSVGASGFTAEFGQIVEPVLMTVPSAQALTADDYQSLVARVSPKIRNLLTFAGPLPTDVVTELIAQVLQAVEARVIDTSEI